MNIKTDGPVDLCFSRAEGKLSTDTISTIGQTIGQIGSSLAQRQRQFTEVEQKCGKRPTLPGKRRKAWDACATEYAKSAGVPATDFTAGGYTPPADQNVTPPKAKVPTWAWVVGGVALLGVVGFVIYKTSKK